jgi:hypothetical protein
MEPAKGGVVPANEWRVIDAGPVEYFIPFPKGLPIPESVRLLGVLKDAMLKRLFGE